jgi:hypothetical protein
MAIAHLTLFGSGELKNVMRLYDYFIMGGFLFRWHQPINQIYKAATI